ncbi:MAG: Bax inhibitor-1/YccA family protein [Actinomycetales bacterium]|nr:Bax inhibitor-1/YccA family protein [Actinomycetales bacterium]
MQSNNPILSRYEKPADKGGFAYDEGKRAYAQAAGTAPATQTLTPPGGQPPTATDDTFATITAGAGLRLTLNDVIVKTLIVFAVVVVFAFVGWNLAYTMPWILLPSLIIATVFGFINALKKKVSPALVLLYAVFEGVLLGAISNWYNQYALGSDYQGIVLQAVMATMVTLGVMLVLYVTGIVKVTKKFMTILLVAGVAYLVIGIASLVAAMFGVGGGWGFYGVDGIGILICVFGVLIAAFFLMLDFEAIKQGIAMGAPERESWRMAFGLTVTLVWIYLEFLRLLAIFSRN